MCSKQAPSRLFALFGYAVVQFNFGLNPGLTFVLFLVVFWGVVMFYNT